LSLSAGKFCSQRGRFYLNFSILLFDLLQVNFPACFIVPNGLDRLQLKARFQIKRIVKRLLAYRKAEKNAGSSTAHQLSTCLLTPWEGRYILSLFLFS
jgi:hypothetical protein